MMRLKKFKKHKHIVECKGFKSIRQVAKYYNLDQSTISRRMKNGLTLEESIHPTILDDKCNGTVYIIENSLNKKVYIGLTTQNLKDRFNRHMIDSKRRYSNKFYKAIRKIGKDKFSIRVLAKTNSKKELKKLEIEYIKKFNSVKNGYNTDIGEKV